MNIHQIHQLFLPYFRSRRGKVFHKVLRPSARDRILDVGGDPWFWSTMNCQSKITCLNIHIQKGDYDSTQFSYVEGDGRDLPYGDKEYDIVFLNSVIEHVGTFEDQQRFAREIRRIGRCYWVQTPNRWFFVEPHLITPFVHYLPKRLQKRLVRWFTIWGIVTKPSPKQIADLLNNIRLLTEKEIRSLFPDATLYRERFWFFTKSFVAYKTEGRSV